MECNIENEEEILYAIVGSYKKLKTKKLLKFLGILDEQEPSVKSAEQV